MRSSVQKIYHTIFHLSCRVCLKCAQSRSLYTPVSVQRTRMHDACVYRYRSRMGRNPGRVAQTLGLRGWEFCTICPFFRQFFHFHKNLSSSVLSGTFSRENRFPPKPKNRPKIAKHTKHEALPKRDNETQFSSSSLKNATSGHARPPKSALCRENCSLPKPTK